MTDTPQRRRTDQRNEPRARFYRENRNGIVLRSFTTYCMAHPEERFWQALRNWAKVNFVLVGSELPDNGPDLRDTFNWEGRDR